MEIIGPNTLKLKLDERVYELINLIKPTHPGESCKFLEGSIWVTRKTYYNEKLANRVYHLINHHLYVVKLTEGVRRKEVYLRVSGRGNINEITREEAMDVVNTRVGYIEDSTLQELPPDDDPAVPYRTVTCDW